MPFQFAYKFSSRQLAREVARFPLQAAQIQTLDDVAMCARFNQQFRVMVEHSSPRRVLNACRKEAA